MWTTGSNVLNLDDTKTDGNDAYGYANNTAHRLNNWDGSGVVVSQTYGTITQAEACNNKGPLWPDPCSSWG